MKHNKTLMLSRSKLNSIEMLIYQALIDSNISQEEHTTVINEEEKYRRMKEDIGMRKSQRSDADKDELNEENEKSIKLLGETRKMHKFNNKKSERV